MPGTSWAEPTSASVENEKTGAPGRSTMMNVQPLSSSWTVVRSSNDARSWADTDPGPDRSRTQPRLRRLARQPRRLELHLGLPH